MPEVPKEGIVELCGAMAEAIKEHPVLALSIAGTLIFSLVALRMLLGHRKDIKKIEEDGQRQRETFEFVHKLMNHKASGESNQPPRIRKKGSNKVKRGGRR